MLVLAVVFGCAAGFLPLLLLERELSLSLSSLESEDCDSSAEDDEDGDEDDGEDDFVAFLVCFFNLLDWETADESVSLSSDREIVSFDNGAIAAVLHLACLCLNVQVVCRKRIN